MTEETVGLDLIARLDRTMKPMARDLSRDVARVLVGQYYEFQEHRIALRNQFRAQLSLDRPTEIIGHFGDQMEALEKQMVAILGEWAKSTTEGAWAQSQLGIGPVLSAGLAAHIDIEKAPTAGHIWRFAGLDPTVKWLGQKGAATLLGAVLDGGPGYDGIDLEGPDENLFTEAEVAELDEALTETKSQLTRQQLWVVSRLTNRKIGNLVRLAKGDDGKITRTSMLRALSKRPWNADLKVLCWRIGDSFVKVSGRPNGYYGHIYAERKALEVERNEAGLFADQAAESLKVKKISNAELKKTYEAGKLPPGRIDLRARRYAVKLFLSHYHHVAFEGRFGEAPPLPYPIAHGQHVHFIPPPES